jgi:hypothetical protein
LLKIKTFILENFLDTPRLSLIRFLQKVSMVNHPLELFSLEEKAAPVAGAAFSFALAITITASASTALRALA